MARIKYGGIITDISGSVGGATFQKSLFGKTLRNKPIPRKSATPAQLQVRSYMMQLHAAWSNLTDVQRLQWNRFINFSGQTIKRDSGITMTGHDLFIKYNMFRLQSYLPILSDVSYISNPLPIPMLVCSFVSGDFVILFDSAIDPAIQWFVFKMTSFRMPSLSFSKIGLKHFAIIPAYGNFFYIQSFFLNLFGELPIVGRQCHFSLRFFSTTAPLYTPERTGIITIEP